VAAGAARHFAPCACEGQNAFFTERAPLGRSSARGGCPAFRGISLCLGRFICKQSRVWGGEKLVQIGNEGAAFKSQLGYISVLVVRDVMCPAVMKDADPFISQGADGSPPALSVGSLESVERSCPKRELDAVFRIFHKGLVEEERASDAALGAGSEQSR